MTGSTSVAETIPQLKKFLEEGGTIVTVGNATVLANHLGLPLENHLAERTPRGS